MALQTNRPSRYGTAENARLDRVRRAASDAARAKNARPAWNAWSKHEGWTRGLQGATGELANFASYDPVLPDGSTAPAANTSKAGLSADATAYTVQTGDTGVGIATKLVGDGGRWTELRDANPGKADPNYGIALYSGDVLVMPAAWTALLAPPPVTPPAGVVDVGLNATEIAQVRDLLGAWVRSADYDRSADQYAPGYPSSEDLAMGAIWGKEPGFRDIYAADGFSKWYQRKNGTDLMLADVSLPRQSLLKALQNWSLTQPTAPKLNVLPDIKPVSPLDTSPALSQEDMDKAKIIVAAWAASDGKTLLTAAGQPNYPSAFDVQAGAPWTAGTLAVATAFDGWWRLKNGEANTLIPVGLPTSRLFAELNAWFKSAPTPPGYKPGDPIPAAGGSDSSTAILAIGGLGLLGLVLFSGK